MKNASMTAFIPKNSFYRWVPTAFAI